MSEKNARRIKAWMTLNGVRQADIAREMGLSRTMIQRFITGTVPAPGCTSISSTWAAQGIFCGPH